MTKRLLIVVQNQQALPAAIKLVGMQVVDKPIVITVEDQTRTLTMNAAQWPILTAIAQQKQWPVDGELKYITADDYKDILTSAFRKETFRIAKGYDGGMVMLGSRTSKFTVKEFPEWLSFLNAVADEWGIKIPMGKAQAKQYG